MKNTPHEQVETQKLITDTIVWVHDDYSNQFNNLSDETQIVANGKLPFVTDLLCKLSAKVWVKIILEPEFWYAGQIIYPNWKKVFFKTTNFNLNPLWSIEIAKDKWYTKYFLSQNWYLCPKWKTFFSEKLNVKLKVKRTVEEWLEYAKTLGFPVILKPNSLSQWVLVWKACNEKEYYALAKKILQLANVMIVEEFCKWNDYRIVVLDDTVISAYQRIHLNVTWDWFSTIRELMKEKQEKFEMDGRWEKIIFDDFRIKMVLRRKNLTLKSILPLGKNVSLLDNANLSAWWDPRDFTKKIHPDFVELCIKVTKDMWLRLCWVDLITSDITKPLEDYNILEISWAPWLDNYAAKWEEQVKIVEELYTQILLTMWR